MVRSGPWQYRLARPSGTQSIFRVLERQLEITPHCHSAPVRCPARSVRSPPAPHAQSITHPSDHVVRSATRPTYGIPVGSALKLITAPAHLHRSRPRAHRDTLLLLTCIRSSITARHVPTHPSHNKLGRPAAPALDLKSISAPHHSRARHAPPLPERSVNHSPITTACCPQRDRRGPVNAQ